MKQLTFRPADRSPASEGRARSSSSEGRLGWVRRFGQDVVDRKLDSATRGLVRREKYSSAMIVAFRIARELEGPLRELDRHIARLDRWAEREPAIRRVVESLRQDRKAIVNAIRRLREIEPPEGAAA